MGLRLSIWMPGNDEQKIDIKIFGAETLLRSVLSNLLGSSELTDVLRCVIRDDDDDSQLVGREVPFDVEGWHRNKTLFVSASDRAAMQFTWRQKNFSGAHLSAEDTSARMPICEQVLQILVQACQQIGGPGELTTRLPQGLVVFRG